MRQKLALFVAFMLAVTSTVLVTISAEARGAEAQTAGCTARPGALYATVAWDVIDSAVNYSVKRSVDGGAWSELARLPHPINAYADKPNPTGSVQYKVDALDAANNTIQSQACVPYAAPSPYTYLQSAPGTSIVDSSGQTYQPLVGAPADTGGACAIPAGSEVGDAAEGFGGATPRTGKYDRVVLKRSFWLAPVSGQLLTVKIEGTVRLQHAPDIFGGAFRIGHPGGSYSNYTGGDRIDQFSKTFSVGSPAYYTLSFENGYTVTPGSAFSFDVHLSAIDQNGNPVETSQYLNRCGLMNRANWQEWGLYLELAEELGSVALTFVPGYDCAQIILNGPGWWNTAGCLADLTAAGITVDAARALRIARLKSGSETIGIVAEIGDLDEVATAIKAAINQGQTGDTLAATAKAARLNYRPSSFWNLADNERGLAAEAAGGNFLNQLDNAGRVALPANFKTYDYWNEVTGLATSVKSIDLTRKEYSAALRTGNGSLPSMINGFLDEIENFTSYNLGGVSLDAGDIAQSELILVLEGNSLSSLLSSTARRALVDAHTRAHQLGVNLHILYLE